MFQPHKLPNGLTLYTAPMNGTQTATVLVLVRAGSKYETKRINGLSHFLEHMFFKGTVNRPTPLLVAETLDRIGGEYNAFTDKEHTGYYAKVDKQHVALAIDWVSDMLLNSLMKEDEIEREKGVIAQEIGMYYDTPTSYIGNIFENLLYGDQPAGWDTAGSKEVINTFTRADFTSYIKKQYSANQTIVVVAGNIQPAKVRTLVAKHFGPLDKSHPAKMAKVKERQNMPGFVCSPKQTDQTHLALGVRSFGASDKRRHALGILAATLGGSMSSRLFVSLREEAGLAYYVSTGGQHYSDSGYLVTNAGVPNTDVARAVEIIMNEYRAVLHHGITDDELKKAKDGVKGRALLRLESSSAMANFIGDQIMLYGKAEPIDIILKKISAVTVKDVHNVAKDIFKTNKLNLAIIGPKPTKQAEQALKKILVC